MDLSYHSVSLRTKIRTLQRKGWLIIAFKIRILHDKKHWLRYLLPVWLNRDSMEPGDRKVYRWIIFVFHF